ncbi:MAG: acetyl/propionyl/methylcrotonyl-CoA carboxylase subunit alpha [Litorimonas sp.]
MKKHITKILIANRGEIACRVIKTARKMGIATVAVYSDADRKALHVRMADEAVHIGASPAIESYLVIEKIIKAAKETGADAVHPGYGFLSENPEFVRACNAAGLIFIGPSPESMEAMGLKDAAKKLMDAAGVPTTPGYHGADQSPKLLRAKAGTIGYPVLIKAVAGGGGKGMRKVEADEDFDAALASCQRESKSSFGNDQVLIEKYITSPRHIEVQVFGDSHGHVVHMFERDCSLQRRHQKVIEEAPAPGMTDAVRKAMTDAAINAAKAVNYVGAGTVEFIVDGSGKLKTDGFWFMEMNTRLQVEHPVTEMITGLDLVELQIRVAQGEKLPKQKDIKMEGHAVEARLYAEDPANDFLPSIGKVEHFGLTDYDKGARIDTGIAEGDSIRVYYDPMIAKAIYHDDNRESAIEGLIELIYWDEIEPITTNIRFLKKMLELEEFKSANISTHLIPEKINDLIPEDLSNTDEALAMAASKILFPEEHETPEKGAFARSNGWKLNIEPSVTYHFERNGIVEPVTLFDINSGYYKARIGANIIRMQIPRTESIDTNVESLKAFHNWQSDVRDNAVILWRDDSKFSVTRYRPSGDSISAYSSNSLTAPMPGKIIAVNVKVGDTVNAGDALIVMEAMKMEMSLEAPRDGIVAEINAQTAELVADGDILLTLEALETNTSEADTPKKDA